MAWLNEFKFNYTQMRKNGLFFAKCIIRGTEELNK